jgi:hypothetical protein
MNKKIHFLSTELVIFIIVSILVLAYRAWLLHIFGFIYTDSDQTIMWLGAKHYSQGLFYEPRFYGQAYNTMLEALLAVPFVKLGIPLFKALPLSTSILAIFPVYLLSIITYLRNSKITGIILLCLFLTLPIEYSLITSMPRGFVTGIAFSSLSFLFLYKFNSKYAFFFVLFISVLSYSINANSIVLSIPICTLFFLKNYRNRKFYLYAVLGLFFGFIIHYLIARFYVNNPNYNLHSYQMQLSFESLKKGLFNLDKFFNYIVPFFLHPGWLIVLSFIPLSYMFYRKTEFETSLVSLSIPILILGTLLISKVHDGTDSIFFSYSRMYLSVPIILLLILSFWSINKRKWMVVLILISVIYTGINVATSKQAIEKNMKKNHVVTTLKSELAYKECSELLSISQKNNIELIVIINHWFYDVYNYGCPACMEQFPNTLRPNYERRTWRLIEDENKIYSNILIIDLNRKFDQEFSFISKIEDKAGLYIVKNNNLKTSSLLNELNVFVRKY